MGARFRPPFFVALARSSTMFRTSLARMAGPMRRAAEAEAVSGTKLKFSLLLPHKPLYQEAMVDQVTIPGSTGEFAVLKGHQQTLDDLAPGVLEVVNDGEATKFFISGGFAFVHADKTTIAAVEADDAKEMALAAVNCHQAMEYAISKR